MSRMTIALLSDEADLPLDDTASSDAAIDEIVESPESDLAAASDIATELDEADAAIDEGADTAEALGGIQDKLEESVETGGIDPVAAEAIKIAVEHMSARVGLRSRSGIAIEGFKSKTTRVQATRIAIESIADKIKQIWQAIVNAFNTAIEWVKKFFAKLFDGATKLKNRAIKLQAAAKEKAGKKIPAGETVDNENLAEALRLNGAVIGVDKLASELGSVKTHVTSKTGPAILAQMTVSAAEKVLETVENDDQFNAALVEFAKIAPKFAKSYKVEGLNEKLKATATENMLGDKVFLAVGLADGASADDVKQHIGGSKVTVADAEGKKPLMKTQMVALSPEQAGSVAKEVESIADALLASKGAIDKVGVAQKKLQAYAKKLAGSTKDSGAKNAMAASKVAKAAMSATSSALAAGNQFALSSGNAALNYSAASLALAGKEEKKEEKK